MKSFLFLLSIILFSDSAFSQVIAPPNGSRSDTDLIFTKVEIPPTFPGGRDGWRNFVRKNLSETPAIFPVNDSMTVSIDSVVLKMVVDETGLIKYPQIIVGSNLFLNKFIFDLIKKFPKWHPAENGGRRISFYMFNKLTFEVNYKNKRVTLLSSN